MEIYNKAKVMSIIGDDKGLTELLDKLDVLQEGEGIFISKSEWTRKTRPKETLAARKINYVSQKELEIGWLIVKKTSA